MSDQREPVQLIPVTIKLVVALPVEWPKPEKKLDYSGPLAKSADKLLDQVMDWVPIWKHSYPSEIEHNGEMVACTRTTTYSGEVQAVEVEMGTDCDWGYRASDLADELSKPGVYIGMNSGGPTIYAARRGEAEQREPMADPAAVEAVMRGLAQ